MKEEVIVDTSNIDPKTNFDLADEIHRLVFSNREKLGEELYTELNTRIHRLKWSV